MHTTSSLLALALALSVCWAQDTVPAESCANQDIGTPCTIKVKTDLNVGVAIKGGVATGQSLQLSFGSDGSDFVSSLQCISRCMARRTNDRRGADWYLPSQSFCAPGGVQTGGGV
jgi:hypothetical protein